MRLFSIVGASVFPSSRSSVNHLVQPTLKNRGFQCFDYQISGTFNFGDVLVRDPVSLWPKTFISRFEATMSTRAQFLSWFLLTIYIQTSATSSPKSLFPPRALTPVQLTPLLSRQDDISGDRSGIVDMTDQKDDILPAQHLSAPVLDAPEFDGAEGDAAKFGAAQTPSTVSSTGEDFGRERVRAVPSDLPSY